MTSAQLQRWALTLNTYQFDIVHRKGDLNNNADPLSRLPFLDQPTDIPLPGEIVHLKNYLDMAPVTAIQIKHWTSQDLNLSKMRHYVQNGWPCSDDIDKDLLLFCQHKNELSTEDSCFLWGCRIIIPKPGQAPLLSQVHETHPSISGIKILFRRYFWWPGLDVDLENLVKSCEICHQTRKKSP